jgi:hypothetical protein
MKINVAGALLDLERNGEHSAAMYAFSQEDCSKVSLEEAKQYLRDKLTAGVTAIPE